MLVVSLHISFPQFPGKSTILPRIHRLPMSQQFHWESVLSLIPTTPETAMQMSLSQYTSTMLDSDIP